MGEGRQVYLHWKSIRYTTPQADQLQYHKVVSVELGARGGTAQGWGWGAEDPISTGSLHAGTDIEDKALPCNIQPSFSRSRDKSIDRHATKIPTVQVGQTQLCITQANLRTAWQIKGMQQCTANDHRQQRLNISPCQWLRNQGWFS